MALRSKTDDKEKKRKAEPAAKPASRSENVRWFTGLIVLAAGIFFSVAVLSHFFEWKNDYSALHPGPFEPEKHIENVCGKVGAHVADLLTRGSFGVFGLLVPVIAVLLGVRTIRRRSLFFNHSTLSATFILILGSLTLGVAFGDSWNTFGTGWGGAFGIFIAEMLRGNIGPVGTIIVLVVGWILTGVFININFIGTVNDGVESVFSGAEHLWDRVRRIADFRRRKPAADTIVGDDGELYVDDNDEDDAAAGEEDVAAPMPEEPLPPEVFKPIREPIAEPLPEPPAEDESESEEHLAEPEEQGADGKYETLNEWYRRRNMGETEGAPEFPEPQPEPPTEPESESEPEPQPGDKMADNGIEEVDFGEQDDDSADGKENAPQPDRTEERAKKPVQNGDIEEVDFGEDGKEKIIVEEHREAQVGEGEIGSLYDPTKDIPNYRCPSADLLVDHSSNSHVSDEEIIYNTQRIEAILADFGIPIRDTPKATVGPTVTLYEIVQKEGIKISKIQGLEDDIAQSLKASGIRIIAPMPGRGTIGIEVPNHDKETVSMRSAILSKRFQQFDAELPIVIGRTIQNENYVFDLAKMPHLLVAGATGQGKSVGLNAIITSLLYKKHPSQLKFVLIDPKMVEFSLYARLEKHFLAKMESEEEVIITDPKKAVNTLQSLCIEMGNRLELCKKAAAKNIVEYNEKFLKRRLNPANGHHYMPYIVVVIDEFADLIMMAKEVEAPVMRLAQKARAIGIHLIIATQRPDVKVITGGIKANFPSRIAFRVMSMTDSRTIIDQPGANQLIGRGDMLFSKNGELTRIQCAFIDTPEVENIVEEIASQQGYTSAYSLPDYEEAGAGAEAGMGSSAGSDLGGGAVKYDSLFAEIARDAVQNGQISVSYIQRNYEVGFNRAGRIMSQLERAGIVGPQIGAKQRDIKFYDIPSLEAKLQDLGLF